MLNIVSEDMTEEEIAVLAAPSIALTNSVRRLVDAVIRTEVALNVLDEVREQVDAATARLTAQQLPGTFGVRHGNSGQIRAWGNSVVGVRNAIAPPLDVVWQEDGSVVGHATLGAAYEGPAGFVHGGVSALLLDQVCGEAAHAAGRPGMTATLNLRYLRPAKLGPVRVEAAAVPGEGHKTIVRGRFVTLTDGEEVCVEAEGLFILPKAVREKAEEMNLETPKR
jgi:uncharacterized protein (TIGR00369 family)